MFGILISIRTASYVPGSESTKACKALRPSVLTSDVAPYISKISHKISELIALSSATRKFRPASICSSASVFSSLEFSVVCSLSLSAILHSSSKQNVVPLFIRLSTDISPPIKSTRPFVILSPRPVPSTLSDLWFLVKGSNIWDIKSSDIPIPVSFTANLYLAWLAPFTDGICSTKKLIFPPSGVNLTAFPSIFIHIWVMRR